MLRKISRLEQLLKLLGFLLLFMGVIFLYQNLSSPTVLDPHRTFFSVVGIAQILIGLFIVGVKVRE
ncbi:MAG: hypothetical protein GTN80_06970 [Nitrososphaeria archaeon]|nr:hypothetical protein [Nitrososphaeria archaeon]NIQ33368.1 hypothetical protein [Nitrososphaeria archaeon]